MLISPHLDKLWKFAIIKGKLNPRDNVRMAQQLSIRWVMQHLNDAKQIIFTIKLRGPVRTQDLNPLLEMLWEEWSKIPAGCCEAVIHSYMKGLLEVTAAKGGLNPMAHLLFY